VQKPLSPEAAAQRIVATAQAAIQRAWISVSPRIAGEIAKGKPIRIELVTENVGREPATGVSHHGVAMLFDKPAQIDPIKGRTTIFPGNKPVIEARWDKPQDIADLMDGKKILVTYGCVGYFTKDDVPHYTWYCFFLMRERGQWQLGSAPIGNDAN
jgi:hypothetical protein